MGFLKDAHVYKHLDWVLMTRTGVSRTPLHYIFMTARLDSNSWQNQTLSVSVLRWPDDALVKCYHISISVSSLSCWGCTFPIHTRKWNMRLCFMLNIYMSDACSNTLLQVSAPKHGTRNTADKEQSVSPLSPQQDDIQYRWNYINPRRVSHTGILAKENLSPHHWRFKGFYKKIAIWRSNHYGQFHGY